MANLVFGTIGLGIIIVTTTVAWTFHPLLGVVALVGWIGLSAVAS